MRRRYPIKMNVMSISWICLLYCLSSVPWRQNHGSSESQSACLAIFPGALANSIEAEGEVGPSIEPTSLSRIKAKPSLNQILIKAGMRGLGGGIPGALAGMIQVFTLMWLRTIMSYQCRYGTTFSQALVTLLRDGGVARLYRGLGFAVIQAPLARFASTAANDGVEALMGSFEWTRQWGPERTTVVASIVVGLFRILLMRKSSSLFRSLGHPWRANAILASSSH